MWLDSGGGGGDDNDNDVDGLTEILLLFSHFMCGVCLFSIFRYLHFTICFSPPIHNPLFFRVRILRYKFCEQLILLLFVFPSSDK